MVNRANVRWWARKAADLQNRSALRLLQIAGYEGIAVRGHQAPQARHAGILPMRPAEYNRSRRPTEQVCAALLPQ